MNRLAALLFVLPIYLPIVSQCADAFYFLGASKCPVVAEVPLRPTERP